jgi:hypothetical protein
MRELDSVCAYDVCVCVCFYVCMRACVMHVYVYVGVCVSMWPGSVVYISLRFGSMFNDTLLIHLKVDQWPPWHDSVKSNNTIIVAW